MFGSKERIDHIDRRQSIRLYQDFASEYVLFDCEKTTPISEKKTGIINNISANGTLLIVDEISEEYKDFLYSGRFKILLSLRLPELTKPIIVLAKVIWLSRGAEDKRPKYELGLDFTDISTQSQDAIIDFILKILLEQSKNL